MSTISGCKDNRNLIITVCIPISNARDLSLANFDYKVIKVILPFSLVQCSLKAASSAAFFCFLQYNFFQDFSKKISKMLKYFIQKITYYKKI